MNKEKYNYNDDKNLLSYLDMILDRTKPSLYINFGNDWAFINNTAVYIIAKKYKLLNLIQNNIFDKNKLDIVLSDKYKTKDLSNLKSILNIFFMPSDKIIKLEELQLNEVYNTIILEKLYCNSDITKNKTYESLLEAMEIINKSVSEMISRNKSLSENDDFDKIEFNDYLEDIKETIINIGENIESKLLE